MGGGEGEGERSLPVLQQVLEEGRRGRVVRDGEVGRARGQKAVISTYRLKFYCPKVVIFPGSDDEE